MSTTAVGTVNATIGEIEELLDKGIAIEQIARELQEPRANVVAVWQRWRQNRGEVAPAPAPAPGLPAGASLTVLSLVAAAARSTSRQTQQMGERFGKQAEQLRNRLRVEREAAEAKERAKAEREAAVAEVERLEAALATAREKAGVAARRRAGGGSAVSRPDGTAEATFDCRKGCGRPSRTPAGRAAHERHCQGSAS